MDTLTTVVLLYVACSLFTLLRAEIVFRCRICAINLDFDGYLRGRGYFQMMCMLHKWTFKQFYPGIGG